MPGRETASDAFQDALREDDPAALYEQAPCGYLSATPDGVIRKANATFLNWTGYSSSEVIGRRFSDLLDAGGRIFHDTHYVPLLQMVGQVKAIAFEIVRPDTSLLPVLVNAVLDRDPEGQPRAVRIAVFDASDRRSYERELLEAKRRAEDAELRATALARTLQETLIPPLPPMIPELDLASSYRPSGRGDEVGGDFYDIFQVDDAWMIVLGDVSGKGAEAAVVTALVRHTVRALAVHETQPSQILGELNTVLLAHQTERFCTVVVCRVLQRGDRWELTACSAGHPLPLLVRRDRVSDVGGPSVLVGVLDDPEFTDTTIELAPEDRVVLYTDGVTEGRQGDEFYGDERFHRVLAAAPSDAPALTKAIVDDVVSFQSGFTRDDIAVVVLRVPGASSDR